MGDPVLDIIDGVIARAEANSVAPLGVTSSVCLDWLRQARAELASRARDEDPDEVAFERKYSTPDMSAPSRARMPIAFTGIYGGVADTGYYDADGNPLAFEDLPVHHIQIDWDDVEGESGLEDQYNVDRVREILDEPWLPERLRLDIQTSLDHALRWEEFETKAPYAHE